MTANDSNTKWTNQTTQKTLRKNNNLKENRIIYSHCDFWL